MTPTERIARVDVVVSTARIWKLDDIDLECQCDITYTVVVVAPDELIARTLAAQVAGDEGHDTWMDPSQSTCIDIGIPHDPQTRIVCREGRDG